LEISNIRVFGSREGTPFREKNTALFACLFSYKWFSDYMFNFVDTNMSLCSLFKFDALMFY